MSMYIPHDSMNYYMRGVALRGSSVIHSYGYNIIIEQVHKYTLNVKKRSD